MTIDQIYTQYCIPKNLQEHMYRVASVGKYISDNMNISTISSNDIVHTLLLHDTGNILKFDLSKSDLLAPEDRNRIEDLKNIQDTFRIKYGVTPDEATYAIAQEVGVRDRVCQLLEESHWHNAKKLLNDNNWNAKIALYSDMRVGPFGVLTLHERFTNLIERRPSNKEEIESLRQNGVMIEENIQDNCNIRIKNINDSSIKSIFETLPSTSIT